MSAHYPPANDGPDTSGWTALDALLQANALRYPDRIALVDDPRRTEWAGAPPLTLTYVEAERRVAALAAFFRMIGLAPHSVITVDAPPCAQTVIVVLAALRAGLIVAPLPQGWRRTDCVAHLSPLMPQAAVTFGMVDGDLLAERMRNVGHAIPSIRLVFGYGPRLPGGVFDLDSYVATYDPTAPSKAPPPSSADEIATITQGPGTPARLCARTHAHWLATGLLVGIEARLEDGAQILSTFSPGGLAGMGAGLVPWLLCAGTLHLHYYRDLPGLIVHARDAEPDFLVVPGQLAAPAAASLAEAGRAPPLFGAVWKDRHPEAEEPPVAGSVVDLTAIDELVLYPAPRRGDRPEPIEIGPLTLRGVENGAAFLETRIDGRAFRAGAREQGGLGGCFAFRGSAVPDATSLPAGHRTAVDTGLDVGADGFVRTRVAGRLVRTAPAAAEPIGPLPSLAEAFAEPVVEGDRMTEAEASRRAAS